MTEAKSDLLHRDENAPKISSAAPVGLLPVLLLPRRWKILGLQSSRNPPFSIGERPVTTCKLSYRKANFRCIPSRGVVPFRHKRHKCLTRPWPQRVWLVAMKTRQTLKELFESILQNPSTFTSLLSAIIAATVAMLVLLSNQIFSRRQQRVQFLQPKLEDLYMMLNEIGERNTRLFKILASIAGGCLVSKKELEEADDLNVYGLIHGKNMVMLVRLYFPKLSRIHQHLFAAERELNQLIWAVSMNEEVSIEDILSASGRVAHLLRLMEQEMVTNQETLLKATVLPRRFRSVSQTEILNVPPPPEGPPLSPVKK
ncbi:MULTISPECIES: hypothetical protein [unclassified Ruegeria]|uniref:hypothetical protein n=1 Tax=unclassified Ruegeria TaxID=2625375 RepID=UPI0014896644|nr:MULTISPECIES: hypothetical protein [unclassified Ruegeria]NOD85928.1 hypothetical protein [Ruegeria sp. HKCCD6119]